VEINEDSDVYEYYTIWVLIGSPNSTWEEDTVQDAQEYADEYGIDFPILTGPGIWEWLGDVRQNAAPDAWIIDPTMRLRRKDTNADPFNVRQVVSEFASDNPDWVNPFAEEPNTWRQSGCEAAEGE